MSPNSAREWREYHLYDDWFKSAPERLRRLYVCGCCRLWWDELAPVCRRAIEAAEWYADGPSRSTELREELMAAYRECQREEARGLPGAPTVRTTERLHMVAAPWFDAYHAQVVTTDLRPWRGDSPENDEVDALCRSLLPDVFGPVVPPSGPVPLESAWLTLDVLILASQIYASRDFSMLPILADALQDAGCDRADALAHCRDANRPHVRGCWVLDLILGKR
jgi:hypothetical protein